MPERHDVRCDEALGLPLGLGPAVHGAAVDVQGTQAWLLLDFLQLGGEQAHLGLLGGGRRHP